MKANFTIVLLFGSLYLITFVFLWPWADWPLLILSSALAPPLIWLSINDVLTFEIPDIATASVAVVSLGYIWILAPHSLVSHLGTGVIVISFFWLIGGLYFFYTETDGLGIGDAKLFGAGALLLGPWKLPELILLSSMGGILAYTIATFRCSNTTAGIPFGPFIAYSIFALIFVDGMFNEKLAF